MLKHTIKKTTESLQSSNLKRKMELLEMLENCLKRRNTIKKEFQGIGLSIETLKEPFKNLKEETVLAGMINWIMYKMPLNESVTIRFRTASQIYQVTLCYQERHLRAKGLEVIATKANGFILYEWEEGTNYANLSTNKICQSMRVADVKNYNSHFQAINCDETLQGFPHGNLEVTEEDMKLIDEFLNV